MVVFFWGFCIFITKCIFLSTVGPDKASTTVINITGYIITGVVIGVVLAIILVISLIINAKRTEACCFSKKRGEEGGDEEGEEETPLNSFEPQDVVDKLEEEKEENGKVKNGNLEEESEGKNEQPSRERHKRRDVKEDAFKLIF